MCIVLCFLNDFLLFLLVFCEDRDQIFRHRCEELEVLGELYEFVETKRLVGGSTRPLLILNLDLLRRGKLLEGVKNLLLDVV